MKKIICVLLFLASTVSAVEYTNIYIIPFADYPTVFRADGTFKNGGRWDKWTDYGTNTLALAENQPYRITRTLTFELTVGTQTYRQNTARYLCVLLTINSLDLQTRVDTWVSTSKIIKATDGGNVVDGHWTGSLALKYVPTDFWVPYYIDMSTWTGTGAIK